MRIAQQRVWLESLHSGIILRHLTNHNMPKQMAWMTSQLQEDSDAVRLRLRGPIRAVTHYIRE